MEMEKELMNVNDMLKLYRKEIPVKQRKFVLQALLAKDKIEHLYQGEFRVFNVKGCETLEEIFYICNAYSLIYGVSPKVYLTNYEPPEWDDETAEEPEDLVLTRTSNYEEMLADLYENVLKFNIKDYMELFDECVIEYEVLDFFFYQLAYHEMIPYYDHSVYPNDYELDTRAMR